MATYTRGLTLTFISRTYVRTLTSDSRRHHVYRFSCRKNEYTSRWFYARRKESGEIVCVVNDPVRIFLGARWQCGQCRLGRLLFHATFLALGEGAEKRNAKYGPAVQELHVRAHAHSKEPTRRIATQRPKGPARTAVVFGCCTQALDFAENMSSWTGRLLYNMNRYHGTTAATS